MHYLITAGPTHEPIDAVRFIGNRSSGRMGVAIATAARDAGHRVTLLLGPTSVEAPAGCELRRFRTTEDLRARLHETFPTCDILVMAAAVADFRPVMTDPSRKLERTGNLTLHLEATPDLLAEIAATARSTQRVVGFALEEPARLEERARAKLARKGLHAIVANPLETMDAPGVQGQLFLIDGTVRRPEQWPAPIGKDLFARWLVRTVDGVWTAGGPADG